MSKARRRNGRQITIKEVAQAAEVSITTVSNVLNGRTAEMAETTLLRVQRAIRDSEIASQSVGLNPVIVRTVAFTLSALTAGLAGGVFESGVP